MNRQRDCLLIAGIPAIGKSFFSRWLAREHGYAHIDIDIDANNPAVDVAKILQVLHDCFAAKTSQDTKVLLGTLPPRVVVDWGFPPERLAQVAKLKDAGVRLFWFDSDRARARAEFINRDTARKHNLPHFRQLSVQAFDIQMSKIEKEWERIRSLFAPNEIDVLSANGQRPSPEELWRLMNARVA